MLARLRQDPTLETFENDVWWIVLIKLLGVFVFLLLLTLFTIWLRAQGRGPDGGAARPQPGRAVRAAAVASPTA